MSADGSAGRSLKIFINYRRDDTQTTAWLLYVKLTECFERASVFFDRTMPPGVQWPDEIRSHLAAGGVFIALIGQRWMTTLTRHLRDGSEDYVAREIDLALRGGPGVTIIPVLADGARLPGRDELPQSLRPLLDWQAETLRASALPDDVGQLIVRLNEIRSSLAVAPQPPEAAAAATPRIAEPEPEPEPVADPEPVARRPDEEHYRMVASHADNLVVFLGAGANAGDRDVPWSVGSGMLPDDQDLARYLASHAEYKDACPHLAEVAQYAYATHSEQDLFDWITQALRIGPEPGPVPGPAHRYLAELPARLGGRYQMIVTPKYDAALERAFRDAGEAFDVAVYMAPGTEQEGRFVHVPWGQDERSIDKPNEYREFPITAADCKLDRTVIVRINGAVADRSAGFPWDYNCVITEDHYIDYMGGRSAEEVVPAQILAKLRKSSYLFLGYTIADWRLRVFLQRIRRSHRLGRAQYWAVESEPDALAAGLWERLGVRLYQSRLSDYLAGLHSFPGDGQVEAGS